MKAVIGTGPRPFQCALSLLALAGLLASGCSRQAAPASSRDPATPPGPVSPVRFVDVTAAAGIRFRHTNGGAGQKYMPETIGSGCAFLDFDGDGWLDVFLVNGRPLGDFGSRISDFGLKGRTQQDAQRGGAATKGKQAARLNLVGPRRNGALVVQDDQDKSGSEVPILSDPVHPVKSPIRNPKSEIPTPALYRNNRDGTFTDVTAAAGLAAPMYGMGCAVGDYDNDGDADLYVTCALDPARLFRNDGGRFVDVTAAAGVDNQGRWGTSAAWWDYDRDGDIDLFVANYVKYDLAHDIFCGETGHKTYCSPLGYDAEEDALYRNEGNGRFTDVARGMGVLGPGGKSLGVAVADVNRDGWPDLLVANDTTPNFLYLNARGRRFREAGIETGFAYCESSVAKSGMGIDVADIRNAGKLAILVSNFSQQMLTLYEEDAPALLVDHTRQAGMGESSLPYLGFGLFFFDYDNDGFQDAMIANGHIQDDVERYYSNLHFGQRNLLYHGKGDGTFAEVGLSAGAPFRYTRVSRGLAYGDYDNDGDLDVLVANNNDMAELLRNEARGGSWLEVELIGRRGNSDGIGAEVLTEADGVTRRRWLRSGGSYCSESMRRAHFGFGKSLRVRRLEVRWPSGVVDRIADFPANQRLIVEEGKGVRR